MSELNLFKSYCIPSQFYLTVAMVSTMILSYNNASFTLLVFQALINILWGSTIDKLCRQGNNGTWFIILFPILLSLTIILLTIIKNSTATTEADVKAKVIADGKLQKQIDEQKKKLAGYETVDAIELTLETLQDREIEIGDIIDDLNVDNATLLTEIEEATSVSVDDSSLAADITAANVTIADNEAQIIVNNETIVALNAELEVNAISQIGEQYKLDNL
jgi:hypothetical protein